jgi:hypothetical protein
MHRLFRFTRAFLDTKISKKTHRSYIVKNITKPGKKIFPRFQNNSTKLDESKFIVK